MPTVPGKAGKRFHFYTAPTPNRPGTGGGKAGVWTYPPVVQNTGHPTAKPLPMVEDWVRLFTNASETVFDPFAGSGTTLIAAANENRKAVGVELEERYCELIAKRLSNQTMALDFGGDAS